MRICSLLPSATEIVASPTRSSIDIEGTLADLVAARSTLTGEHLAAYVGT